MNNKKKWVSIALLNLAIVALLGLLMRTKMIFELPFIDFKNILQGHSHFAFAGWITFSLFILMAYELLPLKQASGKTYRIIFGAILLTSAGMLFSFPVQGYATVSIIFSTLFIFACWAFAILFIKDILRSEQDGTVKMLAISGLLYLALSSAGPFALAYLKASKSTNFVLYKDAVYTFLHLQYNGFFTLVVVALGLNRLHGKIAASVKKYSPAAAVLLNLSVLPTLFISYLWHQPGSVVYAVAVFGSVLLLCGFLLWIKILVVLRSSWRTVPLGARLPLMVCSAAFLFKQLCLGLTVWPQLGNAVFANRPLIIAFLHLALLGFVSLYLIAHFYASKLIPNHSASRRAIRVFTIGVLLNEVFLFAQGLLIMLGYNSALFAWALLACGVILSFGAISLAWEGLKPVLRFYFSKLYHFNNKLIRYENSN